MTVTHYLETGGFDLRFTLPALTAGQWVAVQCDSAFTAVDVAASAPTGTIKIAKTASGYEIVVLDSDDVEVDVFEFERDSGAAVVRVVVYNHAISLQFDDAWVATLFIEHVRHAEVSTVSMLASGSITVTSVLLAELGHGREPIWIDVEMTGYNVISGVIGDRPIKTWAVYDGAVNFAYTPDDDIGYVVDALSVETIKSSQGKAASDGLVFHENMALVLDEMALEEVGFVTRALRFSGLEHGAIVAAEKMMAEGRLARRQYLATTRLRPEMEPYDLAQLWIGDGRGIDAVHGRMLVEQLQVLVSREVTCTLRGRAG